MKTILKLITALLTIAIVFGFAACSGGDKDESSTNASTSTSTEAATTEVPLGYVAEKVENPIDRSGQNIRLGAYLWYGFSSVAGMTNRQIEEFYEYREPLWGYGYADIEEMEYQIELAYNYGLDFFAIDYYASVNDAYGATPADFFVAADNSNLLDFCLLVVNADLGTSPTNENWDVAQKKYVHYMSQPNSLKIDGKPVIMFYCPLPLVEFMGGVENTKKAFDSLEKEMMDLGYPGIVILGCDSPYDNSNEYLQNFNKDNFTNRLATLEEAGFDGFTGYNYIQFNQWVDENGNKTYDMPFTAMTKRNEDSWNAFSEYTNSKYLPALLGGWDDRPRETEIAGLACYADDRTGDDFCQHILNSYEWIKNNPDSACGNLAVIYAWDEIDEGGYIIPTKGEGFEMLEGMKKAVDIINKK